MNQHQRLNYHSRPPGLIARVATAAVAAVVLVSSFFLGLFVLAVFAGLALVFAVVVGARIWWAKRWLDKQVREGRGPVDAAPRGAKDVYDGEFRVLSGRSRDDDLPR